MEKKEIIIIGGGIIGSTTAYFLTRHPAYDPSIHQITLIEATSIASGASGKAGGLLALWAYPSCLVHLSFKLHAELAQEHSGAEKWGYRTLHCAQISATARPPQKRGDKARAALEARGVPAAIDWVLPHLVTSYEEMGTPETTAQVHPFEFTTAMAELAQEAGVRIVLGSVTAVSQRHGAVCSVTYRDKLSSEEVTLPASTTVLAAGPWSPTLLPAAPISALRAHSVTIEPARPVSAYALFTEIRTLPSEGHGRGKVVSPEIYPRPKNSVYVCGEGDTLVPLPASTELVECNEARCGDIVDQVALLSDELRDGKVTARQACYLPVVEGPGSSGPLVGETGVKGLLLAAGHSCWGIQNGPATGKLISEFVFDGRAVSADISSLDPRKYLKGLKKR
ncbi:MAG: hypothetical protein M1829_004397 [Trizodia sp. TS-e1964]|nr:MAG: hypothetical protein M1829_004397 [Trizodia sp. TS-e1964]